MLRRSSRLPTRNALSLAVGRGPQVGARRVQLAEDAVDVGEEHLSSGVQLDPAVATPAVDEPGANELLELDDLLADRGLDISKRFGRAAERSLFVDCLQCREMPELDSEPTLHAGDGRRSASGPGIGQNPESDPEPRQIDD